MIAVVVPTNRPEKLVTFKKSWNDQFEKHGVRLVVVHDGETPYVDFEGKCFDAEGVLGEFADLIYNKNDGVRNLGFAFAYKMGADIIISLDDDTFPYGDTIGDHLKALEGRYPLKWMNTANEIYMRGFPYGVRDEAKCVLSHGVWNGVADFDASTQLVLGTPEVTYRKMPVPKGVYFPMCIMNVAFRREATPFMYQAPMFGELNRFADIWAGIEAKRDIDTSGYCAVTGYATVIHNRASDPFVNLKKEVKGLLMNEEYGLDEYFTLFIDKREQWKVFLKQYD